MSNDLISRKEAIDILENMIFEVGKDLSKSYLLQDARERIIRLNASFDKEKVIEEIKEYSKTVPLYWNCNGGDLVNKIIDIIEKGGVE